MRRVLLLLTLVLLIAPPRYSQSVSPQTGGDDAAMKRLWLLSDLQALEADSVNLDQPLARAAAKAEIADAAWPLDQVWAKKLLREAYDLTLPDEEEQSRLRNRPVGAAVTLPSSTEIARQEIRNSILRVASRDKAFADQLAQLSAQNLGKQEEERRYASLASQAIKANDTKLASQYIAQAFDADPTLIDIGFRILDLAAKDREAADKLIIQYIQRLREMPLSLADQSAFRVYAHLFNLVFPSAVMTRERGRILATGPDALRAYVGYVLESMTKLEQTSPGSAKNFRHFLLSTWLPLKQYAPELTVQFMELEKISREPGEKSVLPQENSREVSNESYQKLIHDTLEGGRPDDFALMSAFGREDFDAVRKMINLLSDGEQKARYAEQVNVREALSLLKKGDRLGAEKLAASLKKATSIQQVYPAIIGKCVADKDPSCVTSLAHHATQQLKRAEDQPAVPSSFCELAKSIAPSSDTLALEMLDEAVQAANSGAIDTTQGRAGLEANVFRMLVTKNEVRVRQAATNLKDRLQRITALAAIYQWKAQELTKGVKVTG